ncbi:UNVERIFIED_CONTAM: hypothetical protein Sindi_2322100 [Sesamum indicum]
MQIAGEVEEEDDSPAEGNERKLLEKTQTSESDLGVNSKDLLVTERVLGAKTRSETQTPFLGFSKNERSRINISPDSHISLANNENDGSVEIVETVLKERNTILSTEPLALEAPPKLRFRPSSSNNGGLEEEPFNLDEFLRLAHAIIDEGDENAVMALRELKSKWTKRFH